MAYKLGADNLAAARRNTIEYHARISAVLQVKPFLADGVTQAWFAISCDYIIFGTAQIPSKL